MLCPPPIPSPPLLFSLLIHHGPTQDTALGQFLVDNCFNPSLKCQNINCKRSARDHVLSFVHNDGRVDITVSWLPFDLPAVVAASAGAYVRACAARGCVVGIPKA